MKERQSRFDRLREEKKKYPFLFKKGKSKAKPKKLPAGDNQYNALANVIKMMLSEDKKNG